MPVLVTGGRVFESLHFDHFIMIKKNLQRDNVPWKHFYTEDFFIDVDSLYDIQKEITPRQEDIRNNPSNYNLKREGNNITDNYHSCEIDIDNILTDKYPVLDRVVNYFKTEGRDYLEVLGNINLANHFLRIQFVRDINGYEIVPHTDKANKKATILCHMTDLKDKGTQLMNNNKEIIKRAPSSKNSALMFFPNYNSFIKTYHGFINTKIDTYRDIIIINYFSTARVGSDGKCIKEGSFWKLKK